MDESNADMVREFHQAFDLPRREIPEIGNIDEIELRLRLIDEERQELEDALMIGDVVDTADALADLLYVVYGTAIQFGIPIDSVFAEVHRSNMTKVGGGKDEWGKILKPAGFQKPDIAGVLKAFMRGKR
jgi:predicted HAD superfamily Cof-like phosphohydrolase